MAYRGYLYAVLLHWWCLNFLNSHTESSFFLYVSLKQFCVTWYCITVDTFYFANKTTNLNSWAVLIMSVAREKPWNSCSLYFLTPLPSCALFSSLSFHPHSWSKDSYHTHILMNFVRLFYRRFGDQRFSGRKEGNCGEMQFTVQRYSCALSHILDRNALKSLPRVDEATPANLPGLNPFAPRKLFDTYWPLCQNGENWFAGALVEFID